MLKIVTASMFLSTKIPHVISELKQRKELREFMGIEEEVPKESYVYTFLLKFSLNGFVNMILRILNAITKRRARNARVVIDCTDVSVDVNWSEPVKQKDLEGKDKWGWIVELPSRHFQL